MNDTGASPATIKRKPGPFYLAISNRSRSAPVPLVLNSPDMPATAIATLAHTIHLPLVSKVRRLAGLIVATPGTWQLKAQPTGKVLVIITNRRSGEIMSRIFHFIARAPVAAMLFWLMTQSILMAQVASPGVTATSLASSTYIDATFLPSPARLYIKALGNRLTKPGNERTTLTGTITSAFANGAAQVIWQAPGSIRFNAPGGIGLIYDAAAGLVTGSNMTQAQADTLESLLDDTEESLLYGFMQSARFMQGAARRYVGGRFRADDGKTPNYSGPWYDLYAASQSAMAQPEHPRRAKFYFVDQGTGLLAKTEYSLIRGGATIQAQTRFNKWATTAGQTFPGQIVRTENGTTVMTFDVSLAVAGPGANDATFTGQ